MMKVATLIIRDRQIRVTDIGISDMDPYDLFFLPLTSLNDGMHYYHSYHDDKLIEDYHRYLQLLCGAYYGYTQDLLPLYMEDIPEHVDAIYEDGTFYFTGVHSREMFYFLFGYLLASLLDYDQMSNALSAAFYIVVSHIYIGKEGVADG